MNNYKYAQISSKHTNLSFGTIIVSLVLFPLLGIGFSYLYSLDYLIKDLVMSVLFFAFSIFLIYCLKHLAKVEIVENEFKIKRMFRPLETYSISTLSGVKVIPFGKDDYILFTLTTETGNIKILVYTSHDILYKETDVRATEILREILTENMK